MFLLLPNVGALFVKKYMVMWWMLWTLVRFTHQVATRSPNDTAHWPPFHVKSDLCPSTALLASNVSSSGFHWFCWYAGFFRATLTVSTKSNLPFLKAIRNDFNHKYTSRSFRKLLSVANKKQLASSLQRQKYYYI